MPLTVTDISLIFLGILIIMVLLEVRKLSRKPEAGAALERRFDELSRQMERITAPQDLKLPGGAQIVEADRAFETISEQLERLGESTADLGPEGLGEGEARQLAGSLEALRGDLRAALELFEGTAAGLATSSDALVAAGAALRRMEARLDAIAVRSGGSGPAGGDDVTRSGDR